MSRSSSFSSLSKGRKRPGRVGLERAISTWSVEIFPRNSSTKEDLKPMVTGSPSYWQESVSRPEVL